jgi:hypothetical protein
VWVGFVWREPTLAELLAEWVPRREQCRADVAEAASRYDQRNR